MKSATLHVGRSRIPQAPRLSKRKTGGDHSALLGVLKIMLEDCPYDFQNQKALGYIRSRNYPGLWSWSETLSNSIYESAHQHLWANQICYLLKKYPWSSKDLPALDPKGTALDTFTKMESRCERTNRRFQSVRTLQRSRFFPLLEEMRRYISSVLGFLALDEVFSMTGHGTGASIGVHGNATNLHRKIMVRDWSCTPEAFGYAVSSLWTNVQFRTLFMPKSLRNLVCYTQDSFADEVVRKHYRETKTSQISLVPKTAKTHRVIAVEPLLNGYVQRGFDAVLRKRLLRAGCDLKDQTLNQRLARQGSIDGSYATIDLSSASDTISKNVVRYLLPRPWYGALLRARTHYYTDPVSGVEKSFHKFSSMGNNFTFPLETLIFKAAAHVCCKHCGLLDKGYSIYGDDIVIPTEAATLTLTLLKFLGFLPNEEKTFTSGPFRESCGSDWYSGQDVRPVVLDYRLTDTSAIMIFHNACQRSEGTAEIFSNVLPYLRSLVPERERLVRPPFGQKVSLAGYATTLTEQRNLNGAFTVPMDVVMTSMHTKWLRKQYRWSWKEFLFLPILDAGLESSQSDLDYEEVSYLAFLQGYREGKPTLRYDAKRRLVKI